MITIKDSIKSLYVILILAIAIISNSLNDVVEDKAQIDTESNYKVTSPTPVEMYQLIEKYADTYGVPRHIAYNIAYKETRYKGPLDWAYKPSLESFAGAVGPMQVMTPTATLINNRTISKSSLRYDIILNIKTSMKLLKKLYGIYGNWTTVCGAYNTGRPIVNDYAVFCSTNKDYKKNWVYYQK